MFIDEKGSTLEDIDEAIEILKKIRKTKMPKVDWKRIGKVALGIGEQLFPVIGVVEQLTKFKQLSNEEKQTLAFEALHDQLIAGLLPQQAQDPRVEQAIRKLIDAAVEVNNTLAQVKSESK